MAEYQEVIHNWRRMCNAVQDSNMNKVGHGWCDNCPIKNECWSNQAVASVAERRMLCVEPIIQKWAAEHPEPVYPSWVEWFRQMKMIPPEQKCFHTWLLEPMPADIAQKLGIEPR